MEGQAVNRGKVNGGFTDIYLYKYSLASTNLHFRNGPHQNSENITTYPKATKD